MGLPEGEEIMTLAFFVLTQYRRVTDRRTDRETDGHVAVAKTRAGKNHIDENASGNLSAVVHFKCRILSGLTFKPQNN